MVTAAAKFQYTMVARVDNTASTILSRWKTTMVLQLASEMATQAAMATQWVAALATMALQPTLKLLVCGESCRR